MRALLFAVAVVSLLAWSSAEGWSQEAEIVVRRYAVQSNPSDPVASLALGRALRRAGQSAQAQTELHRARAVAGSRAGSLSSAQLVDLHWELARVRLDQHDFFQARAECDALGALPGAAADGHACAADAHLVWERATEALVEAAAALALDPQCYEAKVAEGHAYELALEPKKSEAAFRTAIAWRSEGVDAHIGLGRVLLKIGKNDEALAELRLAVQLDPRGPDALFELAGALGQGVESASLLERATGERPSFAEAWAALGAQQLSAGRFADARKAAEAAVKNDPKSVAPHVLLGKIALADHRLDEAIKEGNAALQILANSASAKLLVADAEAQKGEIDRALEAYQAAWGLDRADPTPLVHASVACHAAGRDTSARAFGTKATQEFPAWGAGWASLGDALLGQGERLAARDAYAKALLSGNGPLDREAVRKKLATLR